MRIAVLIIGLLLGLLMFIQTVLVAGLGSMAEDEATATAGSTGVFMAILWLIACALVIPFPMVSVVAFSLAALMGFAASADFPDLALWGGVSVALGVMSFFGWIGKRKDRREAEAERQRQIDRDNRLASLIRDQTTVPGTPLSHPTVSNHWLLADLESRSEKYVCSLPAST